MSSFDAFVLRALYAGGFGPAWLEAARVLSFLGSGWMLLGLLPALASRKLRTVALAALATLTMTSAVVSLLKALTHRVRPCNALAWCHTLAIDVPTDNSFPSGHATGSFAFAVFASSIDRRAAWVLFPLATLIGLSRIALGVHYPTDVLAGAIVGAAIGWAGARVYARVAAKR